MLLFQFTLPCRERLSSRPASLSAAVFQFTLPCRERLKAAIDRLDEEAVSIHAPV